MGRTKKDLSDDEHPRNLKNRFKRNIAKKTEKDILRIYDSSEDNDDLYEIDYEEYERFHKNKDR